MEWFHSTEREPRERTKGGLASSHEIESAFAGQRDYLYWIALLITGDGALADLAVVNASALSANYSSVFRDWLNGWAKYATVRAAVREVRNLISATASHYVDSSSEHCDDDVLSDDQIMSLRHVDPREIITALDPLARSRIEAEEAQVQNAKALYDQAIDEFQAGTSPRIDVTRTEVQLHTEQYNLSVARNNFEVAKLSLGRAIGLPLGQAFEIADQLPYADLSPPTVEAALKTAYNSRSDFRSALDSAKSAEQALSAAKGQRYPVVAVNGDYGDQGATFGQSHGVFSFQAGVNLPIFTGGRIKGDITQAEAALRQRKAEAENVRGQIDYDVRTAFINLNAAKEQVDVAHQNVDLANDNVARSKERFAAGVTDSVEVVQSEQSLASANDQYITSLYSHNFAKLALARALGVARTNFSQYLGGR